MPVTPVCCGGGPWPTPPALAVGGAVLRATSSKRLGAPLADCAAVASMPGFSSFGTPPRLLICAALVRSVRHTTRVASKGALVRYCRALDASSETA